MRCAALLVKDKLEDVDTEFESSDHASRSLAVISLMGYQTSTLFQKTRHITGLPQLFWIAIALFSMVFIAQK